MRYNEMIDNIDFSTPNPYLIVEAFKPLYIPQYRLVRCDRRSRCSYCTRKAVVVAVSVEYETEVKCCVPCLREWILEGDVVWVN